jgi:hypothetical protein
MQAFLEYVVKGLVQNPAAVKVTPTDRAGLTVYELRLDPQDVGKVIGRQDRRSTRFVPCSPRAVPKRAFAARWRLWKTRSN